MKRTGAKPSAADCRSEIRAGTNAATNSSAATSPANAVLASNSRRASLGPSVDSDHPRATRARIHSVGVTTGTWTHARPVRSRRDASSSRLRGERAAVHAVGAVERRLVAVAHVEEAVDQLDALHAAVVLVRDLVLPRAEAAARVDSVGLEAGQEAPKRLVAPEERRRVPVRLATVPEAHHLGIAEEIVAPHRREHIATKRVRAHGLLGRLRDFGHERPARA